PRAAVDVAADAGWHLAHLAPGNDVQLYARHRLQRREHVRTALAREVAADKEDPHGAVRVAGPLERAEQGEVYARWDDVHARGGDPVIPHQGIGCEAPPPDPP